MMKALRIGSLLVVCVAGMWALGWLINLVWTPPTVATCDGKVMQSYDECGSAPYGTTPAGYNNPAEQLANHRFDHFVYVGLLSFILSFALILWLALKTPVLSRWVGTPKAGPSGVKA